MPLRADFDIFKAYMIISSRDHPGNKDNSLDPDAQREVALDLERYAWGFVEVDAEGARKVKNLAWVVERVRRLPLTVLVSEEEGAGMRRAEHTDESDQYPKEKGQRAEVRGEARV